MLDLPLTVKIIVINFPKSSSLLFAGFNKNIDGYPLLNVKYIFIYAAIWCGLFFLAITVKVDGVNLIESVSVNASAYL